MILLLATACGPQHPYVAPIPAHPIPVGINDGWHGVLPPEVFAADCPHMIRTPQLSGAAVDAFLTAIPEHCGVLILVEAPDLQVLHSVVSAIGGADIEIGNELELPPYELTPAQYGAWIRQAVTVLKAVGYRGDIIMGGVYALTDETKAAILLGLHVCADVGVVCKVGVHLYDASDADLQWLRELHVPIWVTELGAHDNCDPAKIAAKGPWLEAQIARLSTVPLIERVFIYQRPRGATCSDLDTFGIDGQPAAALLRKFWAQ